MAPHVHLEEPLLRVHEALGPHQVGDRVAVQLRDAVLVAHHRHRRLQARRPRAARRSRAAAGGQRRRPSRRRRREPATRPTATYADDPHRPRQQPERGRASRRARGGRGLPRWARARSWRCTLCRTIGSRPAGVPAPAGRQPDHRGPPGTTSADLPVRLHRVRPRLRAVPELQRRRADRVPPVPAAAAQAVQRGGRGVQGLRLLPQRQPPADDQPRTRRASPRSRTSRTKKSAETSSELVGRRRRKHSTSEKKSEPSTAGSLRLLPVEERPARAGSCLPSGHDPLRSRGPARSAAPYAAPCCARRRLLAALLAAVAVAAGRARGGAAPPPPTVAVPTAARDLPAGTVLGADDVRRRSTSRPTPCPTGVVGDATGRTLAAPLRPASRSPTSAWSAPRSPRPTPTSRRCRSGCPTPRGGPARGRRPDRPGRHRPAGRRQPRGRLRRAGARRPGRVARRAGPAPSPAAAGGARGRPGGGAGRVRGAVRLFLTYAFSR